MTQDTADLARRVLSDDAEKRSALALLLDDQLRRADALVVERTHMGQTEAFIGSVSLSWVAQRVALATQLPLLKEKIDEATQRLVLDQDTIDLVVQRPVDWSRQAVLAKYLAGKPSHKFPPILVVMTKTWVDDQGADEWSADGRAIRSVVEFQALDSNREIGLLDASERFDLYALDGQHRVIGIMGLHELAKNGILTVKRSDGTPTRVRLMPEDVMPKGSEPSSLEDLLRERIGVEFIPAVAKGENRGEARRRIRSIFVHVNKTANPLTAGQLAQLDEDDGFAIVARSLSVQHDLLKKAPGRSDRVNFNSNTIAAGSTVLTTLQSLTEMSRRYLGQDPRFVGWKPESTKGIPLRPEDAELERGMEQFGLLISKMAELPSYQELERGKDTGSFRKFATEKPPGRGHMLFRPIGQIAFAQGVGLLEFRKDSPMSVDAIFEKVNRYDQANKFTMDKPESTWYGVLYDPAKQRMLVSGRDLAARLVAYLFGGGILDDQKREKLRQDFALSRGTEEGLARDFKGQERPIEQIQLPPVWN